MMTRILREIDVFHDSLTIYLKEGRGALGKGFVYTIAFWTFQFSIASLILVGLGSQPWILPSFSAQTVLTLIVILPLTPGNSGVAEISTASIYSAFISTSILGVFIMAWRSVTYVEVCNVLPEYFSWRACKLKNLEGHGGIRRGS